MISATTFYGKLYEKRSKELNDLRYDIQDSLDIDGSSGWVEEIMEEAFTELGEEGIDIDNVYIEADIYDSDLISWFNVCRPVNICEEAREELGSEGAIMKQIAIGQWYAKNRIYHMVNDWLQENKHLIGGDNE